MSVKNTLYQSRSYQGSIISVSCLRRSQWEGHQWFRANSFAVMSLNAFFTRMKSGSLVSRLYKSDLLLPHLLLLNTYFQREKKCILLNSKFSNSIKLKSGALNRLEFRGSTDPSYFQAPGTHQQIQDITDPSRGGNQMGNFNFLMIPKWILLSFQYIRMGEKEFLNLVTVLTLHIDP